jgi:uncharacterized protein (UPF0332 family)
MGEMRERWLPEPYNREIPKVFHALRKRREVADYQPAIGIDKRDALVALKEAEHIVNTLRNLQSLDAIHEPI